MSVFNLSTSSSSSKTFWDDFLLHHRHGTPLNHRFLLLVLGQLWIHFLEILRVAELHFHPLLRFRLLLVHQRLLDFPQRFRAFFVSRASSGLWFGASSKTRGVRSNRYTARRRRRHVVLCQSTLRSRLLMLRAKHRGCAAARRPRRRPREEEQRERTHVFCISLFRYKNFFVRIFCVDNAKEREREH